MGKSMFGNKDGLFGFAGKISRKMRRTGDGSFRNHLINANTSLHIMEAYRMARTNLMYTAKGAGVRVFGIASGAPHDGKSLTCANLAISFSMAGKRVLLIDCDMRRPTQNISFGVAAESGLSEYLTGLCETPEICDTEYENVHLLSAGRCPPDPAELLQGERFAALIADAKGKYDCIFLDLPPLNVISDAAVVAPHLDGYVLVVRAKHSDKNDLQKAIDSILYVDGKLLGFVLNDVEHRPTGGYYGSYYKSYYDKSTIDFLNESEEKRGESESNTDDVTAAAEESK